MKFKVRMRYTRDTAGDFVIAKLPSRKQADALAENLRKALQASPNARDDYQIKVIPIRMKKGVKAHDGR